MSMVLYGCEQKADVEPNETEVSFDKELETFVKRAVTGGYSMDGAGRYGMKTIAEVANIKLLYANYESSQKLQMAIEEFNRSSTALANKMLYLTIVIAVLTLIMAILTAAQVSSPIWWCVVCMRKIVGNFAHSYMQRFPKKKTVKTPPVKQYEVSNKSKGS